MLLPHFSLTYKHFITKNSIIENYNRKKKIVLDIDFLNTASLDKI